jgi:hypothetical protein
MTAMTDEPTPQATERPTRRSPLADLDHDFETGTQRDATLEQELATLARLEQQAIDVQDALAQADSAGDIDQVITYRLQLEHSLPLNIGQTRLRVLRMQIEAHRSRTLSNVRALTAVKETPCP